MTRCVALTGATGFVGRHIAAHLQREDVHVKLLVRNPDLAPLKAGVELVIGSLEDRDSLDWLARDTQCIIHCAGAIRGRDKAQFMRVNAEGTDNLVAAALNNHVRRFVHVSSLAAREPQLSPYAFSKRRGEVVLRRAGSALEWTILRPPAVYGPGDRETLALFRQLTRPLAILPGTESSRFSLIYVKDLAMAACTVALTPEAVKGIHELDDNHAGGYSWAEIVRIASEVQNRTVRLVNIPAAALVPAGYMADLWARLTGQAFMMSSGKVRELMHEDWSSRAAFLDTCTDWRPQTDFRQGFGETLAWYRREKWL